MTGEQTLATVQLGESTMTIKMPKDFGIDFDSNVGVRFAPEMIFLFETDTGSRLNAHIAAPE